MTHTHTERMVAEGRGDQYVPLEYPQTAVSVVSVAREAMDFYGLESPEQLLERVGCPVLAWFGTEGAEPTIGTTADLEVARASLPRGFPLETLLPEGSDHMYRGHEEMEEPAASYLYGAAVVGATGGPARQGLGQ